MAITNRAKHAMPVIWMKLQSRTSPRHAGEEEGRLCEENLLLTSEVKFSLEDMSIKMDDSDKMLSRPSLSWFILGGPRKMDMNENEGEDYGELSVER